MNHCRYFIILIGLFSFVFFLSACSKTTGSKSTPTKEAGITLTLEHHESALPISGIVESLAKDFEKETGIHIEFKGVPDAQWRDLLKAQLSDGSAPDIFVADTDPFSFYERIRPDINCIDLSSEEFVSRMDSSVLPSITYDKKVYGITFQGKKIWVYSYNKNLFKKLNLQIPKNYAELKNVCQKIKDAGITPMWQVPATSWHQVLPLFELGPYYKSKDPDLYDQLNKNKMDIKDIPDLLKVIKEINEFADLGYYGDNYHGNKKEDDIKEFAEGKVAMVLEGISWPNQVIADYPDMKDNVGIFIMPWADNQMIGINPNSNAFFGNSNSPHKSEILQFFRFLAKHQNLQKRMDQDPNCYELCWPEIASRYPKEYTDYLSQHKTGIVMQARVSYVDSQWMDVGEDIEKMYADLMTPQEVLNEISIRRNKLAKMMNDPYWQ
jgi:ABC-type sugar transport system, periplasmic component